MLQLNTQFSKLSDVQSYLTVDNTFSASPFGVPFRYSDLAFASHSRGSGRPILTSRPD